MKNSATGSCPFGTASGSVNGSWVITNNSLTCAVNISGPATNTGTCATATEDATDLNGDALGDGGHLGIKACIKAYNSSAECKQQMLLNQSQPQQEEYGFGNGQWQ
ncbi:MAG TPA: hypothetical protein VJK30_05885 [Coxiellaceae bacterium]|nr:hypothetical protein [Coxiellaceae bacterium]